MVIATILLYIFRRISLVNYIWKNIVCGAAKDNIVNISQGPRHCLGAAKDNIGIAKARVIYSNMNNEANGILMDI